MKVTNMISTNGNKVPNQFDIYDGNKWYFQSYQTVIAMRCAKTGKTYLDNERWDYSVTTSKYRNKWLGMTTSQVKKAIKDGRLTLKNLNL
tara:strand:- start:33 stop:302 length:270 start_codon:yes stop_codon:yes gene_type:complete